MKIEKADAEGWAHQEGRWVRKKVVFWTTVRLLKMWPSKKQLHNYGGDKRQNVLG